MFTSAPGLFLIFMGLFIMSLTISSFIKIGKGTLAPWSPTKKLVIVGLYGHVRNPMILGVLIVLIGESILFLSVNIFAWVVIFFLINNIYFRLHEEPNLEERFGDEYREYKKNVPRWIPRQKPYRPK
jgi:protein-S-isoprenylcysteine O-methyltransferase Ste14